MRAEESQARYVRKAFFPQQNGAAEQLPPLYAVLRSVVRPILRSVFGFHVEGIEKVPTSGPVLIAANHSNYLDGVVLGAALSRKIVFLVMPRVYHATRLHPAFHRHVGSIPINLERPDPGAIKRTLQALKAGEVVGIFPEGPFSLEGRLVRGQPGVALIALRAGVPVVPTAIFGTYQSMDSGVFYLPRPHPLKVRFGEPLYFGRYRRERRVTQPVREEVTRRIMAEIARLLEPEAEPGQARPEAEPVQCPKRGRGGEAVVNEMDNGLPGLTHGR